MSGQRMLGLAAAALLALLAGAAAALVATLAVFFALFGWGLLNPSMQAAPWLTFPFMVWGAPLVLLVTAVLVFRRLRPRPSGPPG